MTRSNGPAAERGAPRHRRNDDVTNLRLASKVALATSLTLTLVGIPATVAYAAYRDDVSSRGVLPAGASVGGVDVSGLDRATAVERVKTRLERSYDAPLTLTVSGRSFTTTMRKLGASEDAESAVDAAFRKSHTGGLFDRMWRRVFGGSTVPHVEVDTHAVDEQRMRAFVFSVAKQLRREPVAADLALVNGWLKYQPGHNGEKLDQTAALAALRAATVDLQTRSVRMLPVAPDPTAKAATTAILVHAGENRLYLYKNGKIVRTYGVATGSRRYPTPTGRFKIELKRYRPTWVNPYSEWSKDEPPTIGPGPNNPLGTRALNISAPGIRIHGTPSDRSIGYSVSHGCIRMHMPDIEALYDMVDVGTPVFIARYGRSSGFVVVGGTAGAADGG
jgi:lipoprotein-anchoring transpeptidase ErfK/SrfK